MVFAAVLQAESFDPLQKALPAFVAVLAVLEVEFVDGDLFGVAAFLQQLAVALGAPADVAVIRVLGVLVDVFDHYGVLLEEFPVFPALDVFVEERPEDQYGDGIGSCHIQSVSRRDQEDPE